MNNDLISRSALRDQLGKYFFLHDGNDFMEVMRKVEKAPAVDAVEVVRCRDCKHGIWDDYEAMWQCVESADYDPELSMYHGFIIYEDADFYCNRGERREDDAID